MSAPPAALRRTLDIIEQGIVDRLHIGAQLYISRRGTTVADLALGEARVGVPLAPNSLMLWMSSVKPVVPIAVLQQAERGLLRLDDRVCQYVPEFGTKGKEAITLRHVLTHTGGFRLAGLQWSAAPWEQLIAEICDCELEAKWVPGRDAGYHVASGWYILAEIVRRLDGRPFSQYARAAIFEPLGMYDSWIGMPAARHSRYGDRIAPMHSTETEQLLPHPYWPWSGSAEACAICRPGGSGWGPIRELGWLYEALLRGGERNGHRVLLPQTVEAMITRHTVGILDQTFKVRLDRGLGVVIDSKAYGIGADWFGEHCSPRTFGHSGFRSSVAFADPESQLVVALVFNGMAAEAQHEARVRATVNAIYEDLALASAS